MPELKCDVTGINLLPGGFMDAKTSEQIMKCPWFWSKKKLEWFRRDEWLPVHRHIEDNPWEKDEDFA